VSRPLKGGWESNAVSAMKSLGACLALFLKLTEFFWPICGSCVKVRQAARNQGLGKDRSGSRPRAEPCMNRWGSIDGCNRSCLHGFEA